MGASCAGPPGPAFKVGFGGKAVHIAALLVQPAGEAEVQ